MSEAKVTQPEGSGPGPHPRGLSVPVHRSRKIAGLAFTDGKSSELIRISACISSTRCGSPEFSALGFLSAWPQALQFSRAPRFARAAGSRVEAVLHPACLRSGWRAAGIWWAEARNAAKDLKRHRTVLQGRVVRAPNVSSPEIEKLRCRPSVFVSVE